MTHGLVTYRGGGYCAKKNPPSRRKLDKVGRLGRGARDSGRTAETEAEFQRVVPVTSLVSTLSFTLRSQDVERLRPVGPRVRNRLMQRAMHRSRSQYRRSWSTFNADGSLPTHVQSGHGRTHRRTCDWEDQSFRAGGDSLKIKELVPDMMTGDTQGDGNRSSMSEIHLVGIGRTTKAGQQSSQIAAAPTTEMR
ncbi:hypothetical protein BKA93DRAFT_751241 [Sparassis latifolia]